MDDQARPDQARPDQARLDELATAYAAERPRLLRIATHVLGDPGPRTSSSRRGCA